MPLNPLYALTWDAGEVILSGEVRAEFVQIYTKLNGNIDGADIKAGAVGATNLANNSVTDAKIVGMSAAKLSGVINTANLPTSIIYGTGGTMTAALTFNTTTTPFIQSFNNVAQTVLSVGTGSNKITMVINPASTTKIIEFFKDTTSLGFIGPNGDWNPKKLVLPVGANLWS